MCMTILSTRPLLPFLWKRAGTQRRRKKPLHVDQSRVRHPRNQNRCWEKSGVGSKPEFVRAASMINVFFSCKFLVLLWRSEHLPALQQDRLLW